MKHTAVTSLLGTAENPVEFTDAPGFTRQWSQDHPLPRPLANFAQLPAAFHVAPTAAHSGETPSSVGGERKEKTQIRHSARRGWMPYADWAKSRGFAPETVRRWLDMGLPRVRIDGRLGLDPKVADRWWRARGLKGPLERKGYVYFAQATPGGDIKIGFSTDVNARLVELRRRTGLKLFLLAKLPGGRRKEAALHRRFAAHRLEGEWFACAPELVDFIAEVQAAA